MLIFKKEGRQKAGNCMLVSLTVCGKMVKIVFKEEIASHFQKLSVIKSTRPCEKYNQD